MIGDRPADLPPDSSIPVFGQPCDSRSKLGLDPGADMNQMFVAGVAHVYEVRLGRSSRLAEDQAVSEQVARQLGWPQKMVAARLDDLRG